MSQAQAKVPIQNGHVAEAIAWHVLGGTAQWIGGRNPGHDLVLDEIKLDVKSGVRKRSILQKGAVAEDCIGIRLNKGLEGLADQDVDEIVVVVRDGYSGSASDVSIVGGSATVTLTVKVHGVDVYRIPVDDVRRLFKRPFKSDGTERKSAENLDASTEELAKFRVRLDAPYADGDVVEFRFNV